MTMALDTRMVNSTRFRRNRAWWARRTPPIGALLLATFVVSPSATRPQDGCFVQTGGFTPILQPLA